MFVGPVWPASIIVCLLIAYTIFAVIGLIDLGFDVPDADLDAGLDLDLDVDLDVDVDLGADMGADLGDVDISQLDGSDLLHGVGAATIRWTNFGRVPVVIWGGIFAVVFWSVSYGLWHGFDSNRYQPTWLPSILLSVRNFVIATAATKLATQPLLKYFLDPPKYDRRRLVGATCEICTVEATPEFGQAKFRTDASPLLLNVRTDGPHIPKGTEVRIVGFDKQQRIYKVTHLPLETQS